MDQFNTMMGQPPIGAPQLPKPKKPKKPDPAARRMKALDYVSLLLGVEPPAPNADLPPPIGYQFPQQEIEAPYLPPPSATPPPSAFRPPTPADPINEQYKRHVLNMRAKLGY